MKPFDSAKYRRQNQLYGVPVRWWRALPCECVDPLTGAPDGDCELCEGNSGINYVEQEIPLSDFDGLPCRVLMGETKLAFTDAEFGQIEQGTATIQPMFDELPMARGDRVMLLDDGFREIERTTLTRGAGNTDALPVAAFDVSFLTSNRVIYRRGVDFSLAPGGAAIEWLSLPDSQRPPGGARYSIEFAVRLTFKLLDLDSSQSQSSSDGAALPREFVLNK